MTYALWGVLLLTLAGGTDAAANRVEASAPQVNSNVMIADRRADPTQNQTTTRTKAMRQAKSAGRTSENYKADMAQCRSMASVQRSACEKEMRAAHAEGLYRE